MPFVRSMTRSQGGVVSAALLSALLSVSGTAGAEDAQLVQEWQFGERFRNWASETLDAVGQPGRQECESCGRPTFFGIKTCFTCRSREAPHAFKQACDEAFEKSRQALQDLRDPKLTQPIIDRLLAAKRELQDQKRRDTDFEKAQQRQNLENLGRLKIGKDGRELNEIAREGVRTYLPALEESDFGQDPARTLSYFLILDGKGFIENVRCIRGPNGEYLTLLEAYQRYSGTDPQKAKDLLEITDDLRKLSDPQSEDDRTAIGLDVAARLLRLLQRSGP